MRALCDFAYGILKRFYYWVVPLLLDPFDIYERWVARRLSDEAQRFVEEHLDMAFDYGLYAFLACLGVAAFMTYREVHREARPGKPEGIPLQNRNALVRAIGTYQTTAVALIRSLAEVEDATNNSAKSRMRARSAADDANAKCDQAWKDLWNERLVAGEPFQEPINHLTGFVQLQASLWAPGAMRVETNRSLRMDYLVFVGRIASLCAETIDAIDEIAAGTKISPAPDTGGSGNQ